jgi:hypothetical protein
LFAAAFLVINSDHDSVALTTFALLAGRNRCDRWRTQAALWALPAAGVFAAAVMIQWAAPEFVETLVLSPRRDARAIPGPPTGNDIAPGFRRRARGDLRIAGIRRPGLAPQPRSMRSYGA